MALLNALRRHLDPPATNGHTPVRLAAEPPRPRTQVMAEIGSTGLNRQGGIVLEEPLRELRGSRWVAAVRDMTHNDATVGAILFAIEMLIRQVPWTVEPLSDATEDQEAAAFVDECLHDMGVTWEDTLAEILTMIPWGWAYLELIYKRREDGRIGWDGWPIRAQETLYEWQFDERGRVLGMVQQAPPSYAVVTIPVEKALHFRTTSHKGNPEGFALAPDTPIPTPDGWRTMEDLQPGDKVFDERGKIRYVMARQEWENRPCYAVRFNDGSEIVADENHLWVTQLNWERAKGVPGKPRSTKEIAETVKTARGVSNHAIPWAGPLDYPEQMLPIDPYFLGYWLGDGISLQSSITTHERDVPELVASLSSVGYRTTVAVNGYPDGAGRIVRVLGDEDRINSPQTVLRMLGLIGNKHIPPSYMRGSIQQRRALLAGLMDSDGTVDAYGRCEFNNADHGLIAGVAELVRSLGCSVSVTTRKKTGGSAPVINGRSVGLKSDQLAVKFTPSWSPFRLKRKADRTLAQRARVHHYITDVEPVEPRRTICIEVDSPSNLFLAGRSMIPTHNSLLRRAWRAWNAKRRIENLEGIGIERDLAGLPTIKVPAAMIVAGGAVYETYKNIASNIRRDEQEGIVLPSDRDEHGHPLYELTLLSTGGTRQFDTDKTITRYRADIVMSVLMDFLVIGHEDAGSWALNSSKTKIAATALGGWCKSISAVVNRKAIPDLLALNGMRGQCQLIHGDIETPDLGLLGDFIDKLAKAGAPLFPDQALEDRLREYAGLPPVPEDRDDMLALQQERDDMAAELDQARKAQPPVPPEEEQPPADESQD